jgi:hypothetical protein
MPYWTTEITERLDVFPLLFTVTFPIWFSENEILERAAAQGNVAPAEPEEIKA